MCFLCVFINILMRVVARIDLYLFGLYNNTIRQGLTGNWPAILAVLFLTATVYGLGGDTEL